MTAEQNAARRNHWNPNESAEWALEARRHDAPLNAGPSATTATMLMVLGKIGATGEEKEATAWGIFAFFNKGLKLNRSGTHRFHEVMSVAANYGVPYEEWDYGNVPNE